MALFGELTYDTRVQREARTLARSGYDITIVCLRADERPVDLPANVEVVVSPPPPKAVVPGAPNPFFEVSARGRIDAPRKRASWFLSYVRGVRTWGRQAVAAVGPVDVWHAHDLTGLAAIVPSVRRQVPVVYDSHELFVDTGTALRLPRLARLLLAAYERRLVSDAAAVVTVNTAVADVLRERFKRQVVFAIHNCPERWLPKNERSTALRAAIGLPEEVPIILYHGALSANRGIEQLMQTLLEPGLEDAHLVLMGFGELSESFRRASTNALWGGRVHVLGPIRPAELLEWVSSADVGAMPIQPTTRNLRLSTPNKLFECLAAGTPVVASDFPGMRRIIVDDPEGPLGALCDPRRVESIGEAIRSILRLEPADREGLRARCQRSAAERWNWQHEAETLLSVYAGLLPGRAVSIGALTTGAGS